MHCSDTSTKKAKKWKENMEGETREKRMDKMEREGKFQEGYDLNDILKAIKQEI